MNLLKIKKLIGLIGILVIFAGCGVTTQDAVPPKPAQTFGVFHWDANSKILTVEVQPSAEVVNLAKFEGRMVDISILGRY